MLPSLRLFSTVPAITCPQERLLQLRVLSFGLFQDWDVGVGVFPEGKEIFVRGERPDTGSIDIRAQ
jgi:hypothetical protein